MPASLRLTGKLDMDAFKGALSHVISRHDSLRMCFLMEEGIPYVSIRYSDIAMEVISLLHLSQDEQTDEGDLEIYNESG